VVRAAFGVQPPARARRLLFGLSCCLLLGLLLIASLPTVGDLWQELANILNLLLAPGVHYPLTSARGHNLRSRYFLNSYIVRESVGMYAKQLCGLVRRISAHYPIIVGDRKFVK
jgi:hypothetical protein